jgi:hypothetical protein
MRYALDSMTLRPINFRLEAELIEALERVKQRDGIGLTEQVRRALQAWVKSKGVSIKAERKRAVTRQRP